MPELIIPNFNRRFTGVSATAAAVIRQQIGCYDLALTGYPLPGCTAPISKRMAIRLSRIPPETRTFAIWHVRRNSEMRLALWVRDILRLPIRIVFTSAAIRRHSALPRWLIGRMDAVVATTDAAAALVPNVRKVVPHGVDMGRFSPAPDRAAAWAATGLPGGRGLATIGRIRPEKGTDRFVAAMLHLLPRHPDVTALIIGRAARADQGFLERLKVEVAKAGLAGRILFLGEMPPDTMPPLMRALSAIVQLPRYEGYGMAPLEGMASGVPFIATDEGHYRHFADKGACGHIVPGDDVAAITGRLTPLLTDEAQHTAMSRAAYRTAEARFSIQAEADGIGMVYEALWAKI